MCGIVGYFSANKSHNLEGYLNRATQSLSKRGPDLQNTSILSPQVGFGHARLSIIDTSSLANQPMEDSSKRFTIIFNGEIFNFLDLKKKYLSDVVFVSHSDTEVLLHLYIRFGKNVLELLNGFFAFAIFDIEKQEIFLARDRFGIKPLHIYSNDSMVVFASELKAIMQFPIKKEIDTNSLVLYLHLNYIPGDESILKHIRKLGPAHFALIDSKGTIAIEKYYSIPFKAGTKLLSKDSNFSSVAEHLRTLVEDAVEQRLVSDVPLGAFLSGGIDSSIVTACASKNVKHLNTFSIGYKDEPYFDETYYANLVAKKFNTNHTVFSITTDEMFDNIFAILNYMDEPFADSSAIAVYLLSQKTRKKVKVALSGDGGDELFAGYNKHQATLRSGSSTRVNQIIVAGLPFLKWLPKARNGKVTNLNRQLYRYARGLNSAKDDRYWEWCLPNPEYNPILLLKGLHLSNLSEVVKRKQYVLNSITENGDLNDCLLADMQMVLPNDMLTKVDLMSMGNGLEVRVPLLDYRVVNYAFSLPTAFKINHSFGKRILKSAFREVLPTELFNRSKKGFEVPMHKWMQTGLYSLIEYDLLERNYIKQQNIFDYDEISKLKNKLFSKKPEDAPSTIWALLVFQYWFKKYFDA
jgi:asparagine synthase (glutamine-hydrolysing)